MAAVVRRAFMDPSGRSPGSSADCGDLPESSGPRRLHSAGQISPTALRNGEAWDGIPPVDPALNEPGLVLRLALYRKNAFTPDVERRREAFVGLANVTFIVRDLAQHMLSGQNREMFTLTIRDAGFVDGDTSFPTIQSARFALRFF